MKIHFINASPKTASMKINSTQKHFPKEKFQNTWLDKSINRKRVRECSQFDTYSYPTHPPNHQTVTNSPMQQSTYYRSSHQSMLEYFVAKT